MKKSYSIREYVAIVMISIGIFLAIMASAGDKVGEKAQASSEEFSDLFWWIVGKYVFYLKL